MIFTFLLIFFRSLQVSSLFSRKVHKIIYVINYATVKVKGGHTVRNLVYESMVQKVTNLLQAVDLRGRGFIVKEKVVALVGTVCVR